MDRRLGRGAFLGIWAALFVGQLLALPNMANSAMPEAGGLDPLIVWAIVGLLQLAKLPFTAWRLNDIGRPPSDALFFCLIPVANIVGLLRFMIEATPSDAMLQKRRRGWSEQIGPIAALLQAFPLLAKTAAVGLPVSLFYGVVMAYGAQFFLGLLEWGRVQDPELLKSIGSGFSGLTALLFLYTAIQYTKRATASRISWLPSLFLLPAALLAGGFSGFEALVARQLQLVLLLFFSSAWYAVWMSFGGAMLMVAVTLAAEQARKGESVDAGAAFGAIPKRFLDVAGPHGTKIQAVMVGNQVVIPGIFYMLQLAFAEVIAVLEPESAALKKSSLLTWGMRGRLFKLILVVVLLANVAQIGVLAAIDGLGPAMAYFMDARELSLPALAAGEVLWALATWWMQVAILLTYHDRVAFLRRRRDERKAAKAAAAPA